MTIQRLLFSAGASLLLRKPIPVRESRTDGVTLLPFIPCSLSPTGKGNYSLCHAAPAWICFIIVGGASHNAAYVKQLDPVCWMRRALQTGASFGSAGQPLETREKD